MGLTCAILVLRNGDDDRAGGRKPRAAAWMNDCGGDALFDDSRAVDFDPGDHLAAFIDWALKRPLVELHNAASRGPASSLEPLLQRLREDIEFSAHTADGG